MVQLNPVPVFGTKKIPVLLDGKFHRNHPYKCRVSAHWPYRVFSLTCPAYMQTYWNKRKRLHKKGIKFPQDWFETPTWPPFHCFGTPIWPPWRHVKTLYSHWNALAMEIWVVGINLEKVAHRQNSECCLELSCTLRQMVRKQVSLQDHENTPKFPSIEIWC